MKHVFIIFAALFISNASIAQFSVHLNYSEATKTGIGIGYDFNKRFWSQLTLSRGFHYGIAPYWLFTVDNIGVNLSVNYNIVAKNHYDIYLGIGGLGDIRYISSTLLIVPFGVKVRPSTICEKLSFLIELQPVVTTDVERFLFGKLGIGYSF
jgi:hypothetical protein